MGKSHADEVTIDENDEESSFAIDLLPGSKEAVADDMYQSSEIPASSA